MPSTSTCPHCHAEIDAETVFCVACGTNLQTGERARTEVVPGADKAPSRIAGLGRAAVAIVAVAVIVGSLWSIFAQYRAEKVLAQSKALGSTLAWVRANYDFAASIGLLETVLTATPWATNRAAAVQWRDHLRAELPHLPARATAIQAALEQTKALTNRLEAIALLSTALTNNPGPANAPEAHRLVEEWQKEIQLRQGLEGEMQQARQAAAPAESVQILQRAVLRYPTAPNLPAARQLLAEYQQKTPPPSAP